MSHSQGFSDDSSHRERGSVEFVQVGVYIGLILAIAFIWISLGTQADAIIAAHRGGAVVSNLHSSATTLR